MDTISKVRLDAVRKRFGQTPVLRGVSAELNRGEMTLLMGPNGAGKSTLINIISTLSRPTAGDVFYGELNHRQAERDLRGYIGYLSHTPMLYRELSGRENLLFFARLYGSNDAAGFVDHWLSEMELLPIAAKPVRHLSRGMTQRFALACALMREPEILLLDEPFTGLDRKSATQLCGYLRRAADSGKIVLAITHDVDAAAGLGDHLIVLKAGRIVVDLRQAKLEPTEIWKRYHEAVQDQ